MAGRSRRSAGQSCATVLLVLALLVAGCRSAPPPAAAPVTTPGTPTAATPPAAAPTSTAPAAEAVACGQAANPPLTYQHVIWVWMENHTWAQVLGDPKAAPYEVALAARCATATHYGSVGSPSLPNYVGATSGATYGITDDGPPASHPLAVDNLFRQVRAAGGTERSYQEDMAQPCQRSSAGDYAVKHNPAAYYTGGPDAPACRADDVALGRLSADLRSEQLPTFAFVTPNLCHDTHDCPVTTGDAWLAAFLPPILASSAYRAKTTAIFVIWDEPVPMPNLLIAPSVRPGAVVAQPFDHYALLRTTEEMLGLPGRLGAAASAPSMRGSANL